MSISSDIVACDIIYKLVREGLQFALEYMKNLPLEIKLSLPLLTDEHAIRSYFEQYHSLERLRNNLHIYIRRRYIYCAFRRFDPFVDPKILQMMRVYGSLKENSMMEEFQVRSMVTDPNNKINVAIETKQWHLLREFGNTLYEIGSKIPFVLSKNSTQILTQTGDTYCISFLMGYLETENIEDICGVNFNILHGIDYKNVECPSPPKMKKPDVVGENEKPSTSYLEKVLQLMRDTKPSHEQSARFKAFFPDIKFENRTSVELFYEIMGTIERMLLLEGLL